jgi:peptidoglycan hydrolase-like protein with peptidoglycan-binding domain
VSNQVARNRIAAINSSGVLTSFNPNVAGTVSALALYGTSTLFAGGSFTSVNTGGTVATRNRLASFDLNTSTGTVTSFNPNMGNSVLALAVDPTSSLIYAGGTFTTGGGQSRSKLAGLDITTGTANSFNPSIQNGQVNALVLDGTATLYAGGSFTFIGSSSSSVRAGFAGINTSSSLVTSLDIPLFGSASALALNAPSSTLYVGGYFDYVGASARNYLAGINTSDGTVTSFNPNMNSTVSALAYDPATMVLYAGGLFTTTGSSSTLGFASINTLTGNLSSFIANLWSGWSTVSSLAFDGNGVYAGGSIAADNTYGFAKFVDAPSNTAPSATIGTPAQISASSTTRFTAVVSDTNSDATSLLIQYSTDNSTWASTTLGTVTANTGTATGATGIISSIDTNSSSSVTLTIDWLSGTDIPNTDDTTVYLRIKPYDGTAYASAFTTSTAFAVDTTSPTAPGSLSTNTIGSTTAVLNLPTTTSTDTNFLDYKIYYSTSSPVTTANTAFTSSTDSDLASATFNNTTTTTITGLTSNTTYYFKLFAFDTFGNSTSSAQISGTTTVPPATIPTGFSGFTANDTTVNLTWTGDGASYMVENVTTGATATTTDSFMNIGSLSCSTNYSFRVRAYDALGVSTSYTSSITLTTRQCGGGSTGSSSGGGGGGSYGSPLVPSLPTSNTGGQSQESVNIAQLQAQLSALQAQISGMGGLSRDLRIGDEGADVTSVQKILVAKGFLKMPAGSTFGYFGTLTKSAVIAFQKSVGISGTGTIGEKTRSALLSSSPVTNSNSGNTASSVSSVKLLQQTLNKLGFTVALSGPGSIGKETNVFGDATRSALIKFQIEYGIIKNANSQGAGVYGPKTKAKILELSK